MGNGYSGKGEVFFRDGMPESYRVELISELGRMGVVVDSSGGIYTAADSPQRIWDRNGTPPADGGRLLGRFASVRGFYVELSDPALFVDDPDYRMLMEILREAEDGFRRQDAKRRGLRIRTPVETPADAPS